MTMLAKAMRVRLIAGLVGGVSLDFTFYRRWCGKNLLRDSGPVVCGCREPNEGPYVQACQLSVDTVVKIRAFLVALLPCVPSGKRLEHQNRQRQSSTQFGLSRAYVYSPAFLTSMS